MRSLPTSAHALAHTALTLLRKKEEGPNRDPLVVLCHRPFKVLWPTVYLFSCWAALTLSGVILFIQHFRLYHMSERYHDLTPNRKTWIDDQIAIAWYILATHLPFVDTWWVWCIDGVLALSAIVIKHKEADAEPWKHRREKWCLWGRLGSYYLLALGVWSALLIVAIGIPARSWDYGGTEALVIYVAIGLFLLEWLIYHKSINLTKLSQWSGLTTVLVHRGYHEYPWLLGHVELVFNRTELKHLCGGLATSLLSGLVITIQLG